MPPTRLLVNTCTSLPDEPSDGSLLQKYRLEYIFEVVSLEDHKGSSLRKLCTIHNADLGEAHAKVMVP